MGSMGEWWVFASLAPAPGSARRSRERLPFELRDNRLGEFVEPDLEEVDNGAGDVNSVALLQGLRCMAERLVPGFRSDDSECHGVFLYLLIRMPRTSCGLLAWAIEALRENASHPGVE